SGQGTRRSTPGPRPSRRTSRCRGTGSSIGTLWVALQSDKKRRPEGRPTVIPEIDTARLTLRAHTLADFDDYCAMWGDSEVTRYIGGKPFTREECWSRFLRQSGHWALMG